MPEGVGPLVSQLRFSWQSSTIGISSSIAVILALRVMFEMASFGPLVVPVY